MFCVSVFSPSFFGWGAREAAVDGLLACGSAGRGCLPLHHALTRASLRIGASSFSFCEVRCCAAVLKSKVRWLSWGAFLCDASHTLCPPQSAAPSPATRRVAGLRVAEKGCGGGCACMHSQIGVTLRDSYGVPQVKSVTGSKILRILKNQGRSCRGSSSTASLACN